MRPCKVVFADGERDGVLHGIFQHSDLHGMSPLVGGHPGGTVAYPVAVVEVEGALKELRLKYVKLPDGNAVLQKGADDIKMLMKSSTYGRTEDTTDIYNKAKACIILQNEGTWVPIDTKPEKYDYVMALSYKELASIKRVYVDSTEPNYLYHYLIKFFGFDKKLDILVYDNPKDYQFVFYQVET